MFERNRRLTLVEPKVKPTVLHCGVSATTLYNEDGEPDSQLLLGEEFHVVKIDDEKCWGFAPTTLMPGYVMLASLTDTHVIHSHRIITPSATILKEPSARAEELDELGMNSLITVINRKGDFHQMIGGGWIRVASTREVMRGKFDWVALAEQLNGLAYAWAGRNTSRVKEGGIDCSGLVNIVRLAAHRDPVPHNAGRMFTELLEKKQAKLVLPEGEHFMPKIHPVQRGDLIFWDGHVGIMTSEDSMIHATKDFGKVVTEPLWEVISRRRDKGKGDITGILRFKRNNVL